MVREQRYSSSMPSVLCCSFSAVPADLLMSLSFVHSSAANVCSAPDDEGRLQFSHRSFSDRLLETDSAFQVTAEFAAFWTIITLERKSKAERTCESSAGILSMGVGEGNDKGSGPRRWKMYLALETSC